MSTTKADESLFYFRCTGCRIEDLSIFNKAGVSHWRRGDASKGEAREVICGTWEPAADRHFPHKSFIDQRRGEQRAVSALWLGGQRQRVDTLRPGARFLDVHGDVWEYVRKSRALPGVHRVRDLPAGTTTTCFAGCAEVVQL